MWIYWTPNCPLKNGYILCYVNFITCQQQGLVLRACPGTEHEWGWTERGPQKSGVTKASVWGHSSMCSVSTEFEKPSCSVAAGKFGLWGPFTETWEVFKDNYATQQNWGQRQISSFPFLEKQIVNFSIVPFVTIGGRWEHLFGVLGNFQDERHQLTSQEWQKSVLLKAEGSRNSITLALLESCNPGLTQAPHWNCCVTTSKVRISPFLHLKKEMGQRDG